MGVLDAETLTALSTTSGKYSAAAFSCHTSTETMGLSALMIIWLIGTLHYLSFQIKSNPKIVETYVLKVNKGNLRTAYYIELSGFKNMVSHRPMKLVVKKPFSKIKMSIERIHAKRIGMVAIWRTRTDISLSDR